jgi:hypothetical protein
MRRLQEERANTPEQEAFHAGLMDSFPEYTAPVHWTSGE